MVAVLSGLGFQARLDVGRGGWPAAVEVGVDSDEQAVRVLDIARRIDPRAATLGVRQPESSVRLHASRAAMAAEHARSPDITAAALADVSASALRPTPPACNS
jgi:hypothetical protein